VSLKFIEAFRELAEINIIWSEGTFLGQLVSQIVGQTQQQEKPAEEPTVEEEGSQT
jgi:hypothetical protein